MTETQMAATAGEHLVAYQIAMLGLVPTQIQQRAPLVDILVFSPDGLRVAGVHVRSVFEAMREIEGSAKEDSFRLRFPLGQRVLTGTDHMTFFCFVDLRRQTRTPTPDVYVIPAPTVRKLCAEVYTRRYSDVNFEQPWHALQPFRNNWTPLVSSLAKPMGAPSARVRPILSSSVKVTNPPLNRIEAELRKAPI